MHSFPRRAKLLRLKSNLVFITPISSMMSTCWWVSQQIMIHTLSLKKSRMIHDKTWYFLSDASSKQQLYVVDESARSDFGLGYCISIAFAQIDCRKPWKIFSLFDLQLDAKILIYLRIIHLLKSSTCFEHYPAHLQEVYIIIVYMQPLVSSLSAESNTLLIFRRSTS